MPILDNPRHEKFAQNLAKGMAAGEAYVGAGYKHSPASATRLSKQVKIQERIRELQQVAVRETEVSATWVMKRLIAVHEAAMEGQPVLDRYGNPTGSRLQNLSAANKALELIGKSDAVAMFTDRKDVTWRIADAPTDELERQLAALKDEQDRAGHTTH